MSTYHDLTCPSCGTSLLAEFTDAVGGEVRNVVRFVHPQTGQPLTAEDSLPASASAVVPQATPAAIVHAEATGVDLTAVEGTGAPVEVPVVTTETVPAITKADVVAAAAEQAESTPEEGQ